MNSTPGVKKRLEKIQEVTSPTYVSREDAMKKAKQKEEEEKMKKVKQRVTPPYYLYRV